ncbi:MAG: inorganic diphosphatase [Christensenellaceae bacterium]|jgi:inorganic pyrophosphatase|nr:inorganic diphosphatase [Christensenellaceae bacterium]
MNKEVIWHSLDSSRITAEEFVAVIEIPKGSKKKYEIDKETGLIILDRVLKTAMHYPCSYGFIPKTLSEDGDPLDVLVVCSETLDPMTLVKCKPIGLVEMIDKGERDEKIIAVASKDPYVNGIDSFEKLPKILVDEIVHFLTYYKSMTDVVDVKPAKGKADAIKIIAESIDLYNKTYGK